jgi:uncharacterized protein (TIGR03083 family)
MSASSSQLPGQTYDLATLLDAWEGALHAVSELGKRLTPQQWSAPTECPGWSAGDVVRHLAWVEAFLAGRQDPEHEMDWAQFPHVQSDFARLTEQGVDVRRGRAQADVCSELDTLADVRLAQIMSLDPLTLDTEVMGVFGRHVPLQNLLRVRAFDAWTHLQDIRRAAGLPGDLATRGAHVSALQMARSTAFVLARNVAAPPHTTMRITVTGPIAFERWAGIDDEGAGVEIDELGRPDMPTIGLTTDWETYARLGAGRLDVTRSDVLDRIVLDADASVDGAVDLAARIPESLAITP